MTFDPVVPSANANVNANASTRACLPSLHLRKSLSVSVLENVFVADGGETTDVSGFLHSPPLSVLVARFFQAKAKPRTSFAQAVVLVSPRALCSVRYVPDGLSRAVMPRVRDAQ